MNPGQNPPALALNLLKRRKQQYRLRRRRYLGGEASPHETLYAMLAPEPIAEIASPSDPDAPRKIEELQTRARNAEALAARAKMELNGLAGQLKSLQAKLEEATKSLEEARLAADEREKALTDAKSQVARAKSDMDVQRRRLQKEREDLSNFAAENLLRSLIQPLDNFAIAMSSAANANPGDTATRSMVQGVGMVHRELLQTVASVGMTPIPTVGSPFDPKLHEAVAAESDPSQPDGTILKQLRQGYTYNGKVLRPAMVAVNRIADDAPKPQATPVPPTPGATPIPSSVRPTTPTANPVTPIPATAFRLPLPPSDPSPDDPEPSDSPLSLARRMLDSRG